MVKKLKQIAGGGERQLARRIRDSAHQIWLAGLGAFAKAQGEGGRFFESLVEEGEAVQSKTRDMAKESVVDIASRAAGSWDKLEKVFEDRVARALQSIGVPTKQDIMTLSQRVSALTEAVERLSAERSGSPAPARRPAARGRKAQ